MASDKVESFSRTIHGAKIEIRRSDREHVTVSVRTALFRRSWDVGLADARWVRDTLFDVLS